VSDDAPNTAFLDANVLYPALLRNVLMYLAVHWLFRPLWSEAIHVEWMAAVRREHPDVTERQVARTKRLMNENMPGATVSGYEKLIAGLVLPDVNDRHVLAAAIHGGASVVVTWNLKHFLAKALKPHGLSAQSPDAFVAGLIDQNPDAVVTALAELRSQLKSPPYSVDDLLAGLERQKMPTSVALLRPLAGRL
jgi:predicted nucleic acid-binding protein